MLILTTLHDGVFYKQCIPDALQEYFPRIHLQSHFIMPLDTATQTMEWDRRTFSEKVGLNCAEFKAS